MERLVPTWTMASTSSPSISLMAATQRAGVTSAIAVQLVQRSAMSRTTVKPMSPK
jgi:hypothetical protein